MQHTAKRSAVLALDALLVLFLSWVLFAFATKRGTSAKMAVTVFSIGLVFVVVVYSVSLFIRSCRHGRHLDWVSTGLVYIGFSGMILGGELQLLSTLWGWRVRALAVWGPGLLLCGLATAAAGGVLGFLDAVYRAIRLRLIKNQLVPAILIVLVGLLVLGVAVLVEHALLVKAFSIS